MTSCFDPDYQIVSMFKQGIAKDTIIQHHKLRDEEHLNHILRENGICVNCTA